MHFLQKMVSDALERSSLKVAVLCLSILSLTFGILLAVDLSKEPVIIERACESKLVATTSASQTPEEVEAFLREAIAVRFDSGISKDPASYLAPELQILRAKEQEELKRNVVDQRMIVRSVKLKGDHLVVNADRLVAAQQARSAIPVLLRAKIASKNRSLTNPYGLLLTAIEQEQAQKEAKRD